MPFVAPWLRAPDTASILDAGNRMGLALSQQRLARIKQQQDAAEAAARLALGYASLASQEERARDVSAARNQTAAEALALRQAQLEALNQRHAEDLALKDQQIASLNDYRSQRLGQIDAAQAANQDYRNARLAQLDESLAISREKADEMINRREAAPVTFPEFPNQTFIKQPSGSILKVESVPRPPTVTVKNNDMTFHGSIKDPTMVSLMGTNAPGPVSSPLPTATLPSVLGMPTGQGQFDLPPTGLVDINTGAPVNSLGPVPAAQPERRVKVTSPSGKKGTIPESQLDEALKSGYTERNAD